MSKSTLTLATAILCSAWIAGCGGNGGGAFDSCGNGVREAGEQCDDGDARICFGGTLAGTVCTDDSDCPNGRCDPNPQRDNDDCLSTCILAICGDTFINQRSEDCDGINLGGATCNGLGFASGSLRCSRLCRFDTSECSSPNATPTSPPLPTATPPVTGAIESPTSTPTPTTALPCDSAMALLALDYDTGEVPFLAGVTVDLSYPSASVLIPGSGNDAEVTGRYTDLTGITGFFSVFDADSNSDGDDDLLTVAYLGGSQPIPRGDFGEIDLQCVGGVPAPEASDFVCVVREASDDQGNDVLQLTEVKCNVSVFPISGATPTATEAPPTNTITLAVPTSTPTLALTRTSTPTSSTTLTPSQSPTPSESATPTVTETPTPTETPRTPACQTLSVAVSLAYDTGEVPFLAGVTVNLDYPPLAVDIPGSGAELSVLSRYTDLTGAQGFFSLFDGDSNSDGLEDRLTTGYLGGSTSLPTSAFERVVFDCAEGASIPTADDFACDISEASDNFGNDVAASVNCTLGVEVELEPSPTPSSTRTPPHTPTATRTFTGTVAPTATTTASTAVCGNDLVEPGETCDDGNTIDGDDCPSDCSVIVCSSDGTTRTVEVSFTPPEGDSVASLTLLLKYPDGTVQIPGTAGQASARITNSPPGFLVSGNDLDYAVRVGVVGSSTLSPGRIFNVSFDNCRDVPPPAIGDFECAIEEAFAPVTFAEVDGVTCQIALP